MIRRSGRPEPVEERIPVLVVDGDARVRAGLRATIDAEQDLELIGEAAGAPGALALALGRASAFVAIVDVTVQADGSGLSLIHLLAQVAGCRIVAMSVRGGYRAAALAAGATDFVEKGHDVDLLVAAIRSTAGTAGP